MSNGITKRQNEDNSIQRLAAQRHLYSKAEHQQKCRFLLAVIIPVAFAFLLEFNMFGESGKLIGAIETIVMLILSEIFLLREKKTIETAAAVQQEFDIYVFQMSWDERLFGERQDLNSVISGSACKILRNEKKKEEFRNWYSEKADNVPLNEGIAICQKYNIRWDRQLRERSITALTIIMAVILFGTLIIAIIKKRLVAECLLQLFFVAPMICWWYSTIKSLKDDIKRLDLLMRGVSANQSFEMDALEKNQMNIFEHRKKAIKIPDFIYHLYRARDDIREQQAIELDKSMAEERKA